MKKYKHHSSGTIPLIPSAKAVPCAVFASGKIAITDKHKKIPFSRRGFL